MLKYAGGNQRDVDRARSQKRAEKNGSKKKKKSDDGNASQALTNKKEKYVFSFPLPRDLVRSLVMLVCWCWVCAENMLIEIDVLTSDHDSCLLRICLSQSQRRRNYACETAKGDGEEGCRGSSKECCFIILEVDNCIHICC